MIKQFDIKNFGPYKNFEWRHNLKGDDDFFKKINILYGRNYSGKTSLSRLFRSFEKGVFDKSIEDPEFKVTNYLGNIISENEVNSSAYVYKVYNSDFVKDNFSFFYDENSSVIAFTVLGEENIAIQTKIFELKNQLNREIEPNLNNAIAEEKICKENYYKVTEEIATILRKKAQDIKNDTKYFSKPTYTIATIKQDINNILEKYERIEDVETDNIIGKSKSIIQEEKKSTPKFIINDNIKFFPQILKLYEDHMKSKVKPTKQIEKLIVDNVLQEWVREGKNIHEKYHEEGSCMFCGGELNSELWSTLNDHFSRNSEDLRDKLSTLKTKIEKYMVFVDEVHLPSEKLLYNDFRENYNKILEAFVSSKNTFINKLKLMINEINFRIDNVFKDVEFVDMSLDCYSEFVNSYELIEDLLKQHEKYNEELDLIQKKAQKKLLEYTLIRFILEIKYSDLVNSELEFKKKYDDSILNKDFLKEKHTKILIEIDSYENSLKQTIFAAKKINDLLIHHFGHHNLEFVPFEYEGAEYYKIMRDGKIALNLSDGERSLISFCYYIIQLEDYIKNNNTSNLIIYIDDPISSLDSGHIFFVFSLIEEKIMKEGKFSQIFISTHNIDFLKYLLRITKDIQDGHTIQPQYYLVQREQKLKEYRSNLVPMPKYMSHYTTEFHFLFSELIDFIKPARGDKQQKYERTFNTFYNVPNNLRKFLEYFMLMKFPNTNKESFNQALEKFFGARESILINRIVNEHSHFALLDRGWKPLEIPELEKCVNSVMAKINENDTDYFNELLALVGKQSFVIEKEEVEHAL